MKTAEQMTTAAIDLRTQADELPPQSIFGDSNENDIAELRMWADELDKVAAGGTSSDDDVNDWIKEQGYGGIHDCLPSE